MKKIISIIVLVLIAVSGYAVYNFLQSDKSLAEIVYYEEPKKNMEEKIRIVAIGDSLTAGYGLDLSDSYPKQLEKKLLTNGYNVEVINSGISGETSAGLLERIDFINKQNPDIILITIGGNDLLRNLPVEMTEKNIKEIIKQLKTKVEAKNIYLMQMQAPPNLGFNYVNKFNKIYSDLQVNEGINTVPFLVADVFLNKNLMQEDGIHPNREGYRYLIENYIYKAVVKSL